MKKLITILLILTPFFAISQNQKSNIKLEEIFKDRKFSSRSGGTFTPAKNGDHYYQYRKDSINVFEYVTGKMTGTVVTSQKLSSQGGENFDVSGFVFSDDENRILFATAVEPIYRYSTTASYFVYDRKSGLLSPLSKNGKQRLAGFSPDGTKIAFVRDNNIFIATLTNEGKVDNEIQVTTDGKQNEIINGATDWVYEEEFGLTSGFAWSPDSKKLAFYRFDESQVKEFEITNYGELYPDTYKYKYPKAGEANSVISLFIYNPEEGSMVNVDLGENKDIYIPRIKWTLNPDVLSFYRLNRHQNNLELIFADAMTGKTKTIYTEKNKYYVEINDNLHFFEEGFLLTSEKDGFNHIYHYDRDGKFVRQVTSGKWEVLDLKAVDEKSKRIFYTSTEISPMEKDLYYIGIDGKGKTRITEGHGTNSIQFNETLTLFVNRHSDMNTPPVITVNSAEGKLIRVVQDNSALKKVLSQYATGRSEFFSFRTSDGILLNGSILKPYEFDSLRKYPVLFCIYGGPGSQTVLNSWGTVSMWHQYLAQQGIIVVAVDNRGTGGRGEEFKKMTYLQLGKYETQDQIEAAKFLSRLPYVDSTRIGMWGWSFGGYMTLSCLTKGSDYFSVGVAVAPVTNWKYYDNIYTERFMRTPAENPEGYESNSPVNHTDLFKGKLLLVHGMSDDNVHMQNSIDFMTAMIASGKDFEMQFYPNSNHGIYTGKNTTFHLYEKMTRFILRELGSEKKQPVQ